MKKELNRYTLVEFLGEEYREYDSFEEYEELLKKIRKYNKNSKNKYLFGNVTYIVIDKKIYVTIRRYNKLTQKTTISKIDELTSKTDEKGLIEYFKSNLKTKINEGYEPDINIAYLNGRESNDINLASIRISYIPVLYKEDIKYLSKKYVMKCVEYHLANNDYGFFLALANKFDCYKVIEEDIEKLRIAVNKYRYIGFDNTQIFSIVDSLYDNLVYERDKDSRLLRDDNGNILKSHRRIRDFAIFVRDYGMLQRKMSSPFEYNKKVKDREENNKDTLNDEDKLQDEYATYSWDQDNGDTYKNFEVYFDQKEKKYKRK